MRLFRKKYPSTLGPDDYLRRRREDARLDAAIHDHILRETGVVEPDEPTPYSHALHMESYYMAARGEFTALEREQIRASVGLGPFAASPLSVEDTGD